MSKVGKISQPEYFKITPPVESCCEETRANFLEDIPLRNKGRPLPKITGAIPIRYSSKRLSFIKVSERLALPKTYISLFP